MSDVTEAAAVEPVRDGRTRRAQRTRAVILDKCRELMLAGDLRPSVVAIVKATGFCNRSVFQHFGSVEQLHDAALDTTTARILFGKMMDLPIDSFVRVVAAGRMPS